jgi:hypothetical protein
VAAVLVRLVAVLEDQAEIILYLVLLQLLAAVLAVLMV